MKLLAILLLLSSLVPGVRAAAGDVRTTTPPFGRVLQGTIGRHPVEMYLEGEPWKDADGPIYSLWGYYYYTRPGEVARSPVDGLRVEGRIDAAGRFTLEETDVDVRPTGTLTGQLVVDARGRLPRIRLTGTWSHDGRRLPFSIGEPPAPRVPYAVSTTWFQTVNAELATDIAIECPRIEGTKGADAFNALVEAHARQAAKDFEKSVEEWEWDGEGDRPFSTLTVRCDVAFASPSMVSIRFHEYYSPHYMTIWPLRTRWGITFDLERGREVALAEALGPEGVARLEPTFDRLSAGKSWAADVAEFDDPAKPTAWNLRPDGVSVYYLGDRRNGGYV